MKFNQLTPTQKKSLSVISCSVSYSITRLFIGPFAVIPTAVLISHEYGHYMAADEKDLNPTRPMFLGIGPVSMGFIKANLSTDATKKYVKKYGPLSGTICALAILLYAALLSMSALYPIGVMLIISELYHLIMGNDSIFIER